MAAEEIRIPDIGDAGDVEVIELCVAPGDAVSIDDPLIVIESDKASMEVPSTVAGTVDRIAVAVGDTCTEGDLNVVVESGADAPDAPAEAMPEPEGVPEGQPEAPSPATWDTAYPASAAQRHLCCRENTYTRAYPNPKIRQN